MLEQRRHARVPIDAPLTFTVKGKEEWHEGVGRDISVGGISVESPLTLAFGTTVELNVQLPGSDEIFMLPGVVRWARAGRIGVQFGSLGARETHLITEISRKAGL